MWLLASLVCACEDTGLCTSPPVSSFILSARLFAAAILRSSRILDARFKNLSLTKLTKSSSEANLSVN